MRVFQLPGVIVPLWTQLTYRARTVPFALMPTSPHHCETGTAVGRIMAPKGVRVPIPEFVTVLPYLAKGIKIAYQFIVE